MTKVHILLARQFPTYGHGSFYPLVKWRSEFRRKGIVFRFLRSHFTRSILDCDVLVVDWRYIDLIQKNRYQPDGIRADGVSSVHGFLQRVREKGLRTVLFDSADAAGTRAFDFLPYFDIWLKKQVLRDRGKYTDQSCENRYMTWLPDHVEEVPRYKGRTVSKADLGKLAIGWNIGMSDFRYFPEIVHRARFSPTNLLPRAYKRLRVQSPLGGNRPIICSYRGSLKGNTRYSYCRRKLLNELNASAGRIQGEFILGGRASKSEYLQELRRSKAGISPFGWGEICYRDFEIIQNGALLVKPSVDHIETWPNLYVRNETYVAVDWDFRTLADTLNEIENDVDRFRPIAKQAQELLVQYQSDHEVFIDHFCKQMGL